jgi:hypothetical protein
MKKYIMMMFFITPLLLFGERLGIGIIIGSPTGFSGKYRFARRAAIAVNAGWSLFGSKKFHCTGDYQFLFPTTIRWYDEFESKTTEIKNLIPLLGIGGRMVLKDDELGDTEICVGMRIGGGVEYLISRFGVFLELYPVVNIIPSTDFDFEGGLGFRFYF